MSASIFKVDAFAEKPFTGNPAGVCVLPGARDETWMQNIAFRTKSGILTAEKRGELAV